MVSSTTNGGYIPAAEITGEMDEEFFPEETLNEEEANGAREVAKAIEEAALSDNEIDSDDSRRDIYDNPHGSMYSGPMAASVPTSMTAMRMRRRSRTRVDTQRSDVDFDQDGPDTALFLAGSARRSSDFSRSKKSRPQSQRSRRASTSSVARDGVDSRHGSSQNIPTSAIDSASDTASEDEEGKKKAKKRGLLSSFFGSSAPKSRPSLERASSSASVMSSSTRRSSQETKKRKGHRRKSLSGANRQKIQEAEEESETEVDETDPYGLYGSSSSSVNSTSTSGSSGSSVTVDDSRSRRRAKKGAGGMFLPSFGGADPVFGDSRNDAAAASPPGSEKGSDNGEGSDEEEPFFLDEITASRQTIYIPDEDLQLLFEGWGEKTYKSILWTLGVILSLGGLSLLGKWIPEWWLRGRGKWREFGRATKVVVKTSHGTTYVIPIKKLTFPNAMAISTIFPPTSEPPPTSRNEAMDEPLSEHSHIPEEAVANGANPAKPLDGVDASAQNMDGQAKINDTALPLDNGSLRSSKEARLKEFRYVDFRYYRFLLHPISGTFHMSRCVVCI